LHHLNVITLQLATHSSKALLEFVLGILVYRTWSQTRSVGLNLGAHWRSLSFWNRAVGVWQWERPVGIGVCCSWVCLPPQCFMAALGVITFKSSSGSLGSGPMPLISRMFFGDHAL